MIEIPDSLTASPGYTPKSHRNTELVSLKDIEKSVIERILKECRNNQTLAAQKLDISRSTLIRKIKAYNLV